MWGHPCPPFLVRAGEQALVGLWDAAWFSSVVVEEEGTCPGGLREVLRAQGQGSLPFYTKPGGWKPQGFAPDMDRAGTQSSILALLYLQTHRAGHLEIPSAGRAEGTVLRE